MLTVSALPARLLRRPAKYLRREFWKMIAREGVYRGRAACLYAVPSVLRSLVRLGPRVYIFPERLNRYQFAETYVAWKVLAACDLRTTTDPSQAALALAWHPTTRYSLDAGAFAALPPGTLVLNRRCTDISKSHVGDCFERAFGYRLEIDPLTYTGTILRKSQRNGAHDACLLQGPLPSVEPGYVYQRVVSYDTPRGMAEWRVFVVGGRAVAAYTLFAPRDARFEYWRERADMTTIERAFTPAERERITNFCSIIGLDFGVLDILRDGAQGRIYICDCNTTPTGPSPRLSIVHQVRLVHQLAWHFKREYLK